MICAEAEIKTSKYNLLYSNRICCIDNEHIEILLTFDDINQLSVEFKFLNDEQEVRYALSSPQNKKVIIELFNFKNPLGTGLKNLLVSPSLTTSKYAYLSILLSKKRQTLFLTFLFLLKGK